MPAPPAGRATAGRVLAVTALASFLGFLDATIANVAFPDLERDFAGASRADLSWVLNAYNILFAALLVPAGRLADLLGRRRFFAGGLALFTVASGLIALAPSVEALVAARALQAVGAAAMIPTSLGLLLPAIAPERRATAVGLWGASAAVAAAVGPSLGGALVEWEGWRLAFLVNVPVGVLALLAVPRVLPRDVVVARDRREPLPDLLGSALVTGAVGLVALALVQGGTWGWTDARVLGAAAAGLLLVPVLLRRSARHPSPVVHLELFRVRSFAAANAGTLLFAAAFYAVILGNILFLTSVWGLSVLEAGLAVSPSPLFAALFAGPAGRLADRVGQRVVIVPGTLLYAAGTLWFVTQVGTTPDYVREWLPAAVVLGMGVGLAFPTLGSAAVARLPAERFALGSAVSATARQLGAVIGVAVFVAAVGTPAPDEVGAAFDRAWLLAAAAALGSAGAALALGRVRVAGATVPEAAPAAAPTVP